MPINPADISTIRVGQLPIGVWSLDDKLAHEISNQLTQGSVQGLADLISDYIGTSSSLAFNPTTVNDGENLPATDLNEWILVGKGTFGNVGGAPDITTTEELNALTSNGSFWQLSVQIPINVELAGIVQTVRSGFTTTAPSENAVYDALALKANVADIPDFSLKEDKVNKQNSLAIDGSGEKFPTVDAVNGALNEINYNLGGKKDDTSRFELAGKSIYFFGDSYTQGSGATSTALRFSTLVAKGLNATEVNFGASGTTMEKRVPIDYQNPPNMVDNIVNIPVKTTSIGLAVVAFGLNDLGQTAPDYNTTNFITDFNTVMNAFIAKGWNPIQILIIGPYYIGAAGYTAYASITGNPAPDFARHDAFNKASYQVSRDFGSLFIDMYSAQVANDMTLITADNIHPTNAGHAYIANVILNYLGNKLSFGTKVPVSSPTPIALNLGASYANSALSPEKSKIKLYDDGTDANIFGIGVSVNAFEFLAPSGSSYKFSVNGVLVASISPSGVFASNSLTGTGNRQVFADATGNLIATSTPIDSRPYKTYVALITQIGTSAPTVTVLENNLSGTIVWARTGVGTFTGTLTGAFTLNKTAQFIGNSNTAFVNLGSSGVNVVTISTYNSSGVISDGLLGSASYEIRVYN